MTQDKGDGASCLNCKWARWPEDGDTHGSCGWRAPISLPLSSAHRAVHPMLDKRWPYRSCPTHTPSPERSPAP